VSVLFEEEPCALLVTKVVLGSSADEAGLAAGDRIVGVDGAALEADSLAEASALVTGEEGTVAALTVRHADGSEEDFRLERRRMMTFARHLGDDGGRRRLYPHREFRRRRGDAL
jgi:C-terminal processing protease CtpA/Prc